MFWSSLVVPNVQRCKLQYSKVCRMLLIKNVILNVVSQNIVILNVVSQNIVIKNVVS
jgi:hypothetical protein